MSERNPFRWNSIDEAVAMFPDRPAGDETAVTIVARDPADAPLADAATRAVRSLILGNQAAVINRRPESLAADWSWLEDAARHVIPNEYLRAPRHEYAERLERENADLRAEVAQLRAALGYSTDNSPALGGSADS